MNRCETCPTSCCANFSIGREVVDPVGVARELSGHSYINKIADRLVISSGHERLVGIYSCDRYDPQSGLCRDYNEIARPSFCLKTGEEDFPINCILANKPETV